MTKNMLAEIREVCVQLYTLKKLYNLMPCIKISYETAVKATFTQLSSVPCGKANDKLL